jgi:hypothetical protein
MDTIRISLVQAQAEKVLPHRHLRRQIELARRGDDIPLMAASIASNEFLATKNYWKGQRSYAVTD